ncbi:Peptide deformylase 1B [Picochlorum sp. SENEW3]|nr:Peptide deformylase 1B [Picochlorum sp. SENEW3]WPT18631.1 Peptide deformylase 1B [Picochlorum sp. SENEW3]
MTMANAVRTRVAHAIASACQRQQRRGAVQYFRGNSKRKSVMANARGARRALQELLDAKGENEEEEEQLTGPVLKDSVQWTSPLSIVKYPDPVLRAPNAIIDCFDDNLRRLAEEMFEIMYDDDGVGLAAPQVGVNVRMMVFNETGEKDRKEAEVVLVNPRIISFSKDKKVFEEGCLSFPKIYGDVVRPGKVRVKAQDLSGKSFFMNIDKFPARIFQHEYDHLQGTLFCDRMGPEVLDSVRHELVQLEEDYIQKNPQAIIQRI